MNPLSCGATLFSTVDNNRVVSWDGTMNMPLYRLADPAHKDGNVVRWQLS